MRHESTPWPGAVAATRPRGLNSLYTRPQLEGVLQRERARADRVQGEFSLLLFRLRPGDGEDRRQRFRLARLLLQRCRTIDEVGWFDHECLVVLLPYTGGEGARAFAQSALKLAQDKRLGATCRIYTYPSAWYFEDDGQGSSGAGGRARVVPVGATDAVDSDHNGNGNGNGHAVDRVDGNSHARPSIRGHARSNGNGHNGNGHNGNGHEGNGHSGNGHVATHRDNPLHATDRNGNGRVTSPRRVEELATSDLMPYVLQGMSDALEAAPAAGSGAVTSLLVRPLPWWKRSIDVAGASFGLLALSPIMILAALVIKGTSRGPVLFKQRRAGLAGRPFWIYKFRTMVDGADQQKSALRPTSEQDGPAFKLENDPRVTPFGRFLRETSLDELPQLWNVLKGDMSLVGPRPLPLDESAGCDQWQRRRLDVTPGLTCIWQVKGRSRVTFNEWMRMDVKYIKRRTLWHDVKILAETIPAVLLRRGAR